jgi:parvulin-like peptidyl-prolyl isomerase
MVSKEKTTKLGKGQDEPQKRFKTNPFVFAGTVIVLVIVVVAFVLVPAIVPEAGGLGFDTTFGYYGKAPIRYAANNYFYQVREEYARQYSGITGLGFERYIWRLAFDMAAAHTAVIEEARLSGYAPPDAVVDKAVAQLPVFQENGRFSAVRYNALDSATRTRYWQEVREMLIFARYFADVSGTLIADGEKAFVADMAEKQRTFDIAAFPINDYPAEEVSSYIDTHKDLFKTARLSQITISSSEQDAQKVLAEVKSGASAFEDTARSQSADQNADRGGDMGSKLAYELASDIPDADTRAAIVSLPQGTISDVVKVPSGWAFFRVEEAAREADSADTATIEKARSYLLEFERGIIEDYYLAKAEAFNDAVAAAGFDNACDEAGITKSTIGPLPVNYGDVSVFPTVGSYAVDALNGAAANENFWKTAFSTAVGVPSRPIVLGGNVLVLFPVTETGGNGAAGMDNEERTIIGNYYAGIVNDERTLNAELSDTLLKDKKFKDRFDQVFSKIFREE